MPSSLPVAWITHPNCRDHEMMADHPECPQRLAVIEDRMIACGYADFMQRHSAPLAREDDLLRAHDAEHVARMLALRGTQEHVAVDADTAVAEHTIDAALRAAGASVAGVDLLLAGEASLAFCAVRPPGHHAERERAMGFCYFNNVAIAALYALARGLRSVAVLDFDVHYGNGTADCFCDEPRALLLSTYEHALYPHWPGAPLRRNLVDVPLPAGAGSSTFRNAVLGRWVPALERQRPELILVSAGFDAHAADPLGGLRLQYQDFHWVGSLIREIAAETAGGRVLATLEGGYDLDTLGRCVENFISPFVGGDTLPA